MDYVARAKALLNKTLRQGALAILPLAAAVEADAANLLPLNDVTCNATINSGSLLRPCTGGGEQLPEQNGFEGLRLFSVSAPITFGDLGGGLRTQVNWQTSGAYSGSAIGTGSPITFGADFRIAQSGSAIIDSWQLVMAISSVDANSSLQPTAAGDDYATFTFQGSNSGPFALNGQSSFLRTLSMGDVIFINTRFSINWANPGPFTSYTGVIANSLEFNPNAATDPVPEPSSLALVAISVTGGCLLFRARGLHATLAYKVRR
jgi:hypothetical protein